MNKFTYTLLLTTGERTVTIEMSGDREAADAKVCRDYGIGSSGIICCEEASASDTAAAAYDRASDDSIRAMTAYVRSPSRDALADVWDTATRERDAFKALLLASVAR